MAKKILTNVATITDASVKEMKNRSVSALPDNPSASGIKANQSKPRFYEFGLSTEGKSLVTEIRRLISELNLALSNTNDNFNEAYEHMADETNPHKVDGGQVESKLISYKNGDTFRKIDEVLALLQTKALSGSDIVYSGKTDIVSTLKELKAKLEEEVSTRSTNDTTNLNTAKAYADTKTSTEANARTSAINSAISSEVSSRNTAINNAIANEVSARNTAIQTAKSQVITQILGVDCTPELDTLKELAEALNNNDNFSATMVTELAKKSNVLDIRDNLTSTDTNKPLSANQGKVLKELANTKANNITYQNNRIQLHNGTVSIGNEIEIISNESGEKTYFFDSIANAVSCINLGSYASGTSLKSVNNECKVVVIDKGVPTLYLLKDINVSARLEITASLNIISNGYDITGVGSCHSIFRFKGTETNYIDINCDFTGSTITDSIVSTPQVNSYIIAALYVNYLTINGGTIYVYCSTQRGVAIAVYYGNITNISNTTIYATSEYQTYGLYFNTAGEISLVNNKVVCGTRLPNVDVYSVDQPFSCCVRGLRNKTINIIGGIYSAETMTISVYSDNTSLSGVYSESCDHGAYLIGKVNVSNSTTLKHCAWQSLLVADLEYPWISGSDKKKYYYNTSSVNPSYCNKGCAYIGGETETIAVLDDVVFVADNDLASLRLTSNYFYKPVYCFISNTTIANPVRVDDKAHLYLGINVSIPSTYIHTTTNQGVVDTTLFAGYEFDSSSPSGMMVALHSKILATNNDVDLSGYYTSAQTDEDFQKKTLDNAIGGETDIVEALTKAYNTAVSKVSPSDIVDNLTTTETTKPLSANQGKALKDMIVAIQQILSADDTDYDTLQEIVTMLKSNNGAGITALANHLANTSNPHSVTKAQVGLENVLNVASYSKSETDNLLGAKIPVSNIVDTLTTNDATKVLSAKQGKALKDLIDETKILYVDLPNDIITMANFVSYISTNNISISDTYHNKIVVFTSVESLATTCWHTFVVIPCNYDNDCFVIGDCGIYHLPSDYDLGYEDEKYVKKGELDTAIGNINSVLDSINGEVI